MKAFVLWMGLPSSITRQSSAASWRFYLFVLALLIDNDCVSRRVGRANGLEKKTLKLLQMLWRSMKRPLRITYITTLNMR